MKILLTKDVPSLGRRGDVVDVKDGHARNFIIPQKLGVVADTRSIENAKNKKAASLEKIASHKQTEIDYVNRLKETTLNFKRKANEKGHLFAAVSIDDIAESLRRHGFPLIKKEDITSPHIKSLGEHDITLMVGEHQATAHAVVEPL